MTGRGLKQTIRQLALPHAAIETVRILMPEHVRCNANINPPVQQPKRGRPRKSSNA